MGTARARHLNVEAGMSLQANGILGIAMGSIQATRITPARAAGFGVAHGLVGSGSP